MCPPVPKPTRSVPQVSIAHDIIAVEDAASLVATELHGHSFLNAGSDHVADGRSSEIVGNTAGAPRGRPRAPPSLVEATFGDPAASEVPEGSGLRDRVMEEDVLHDHLLLSLNLAGHCSLLLQELVQFRSQIKDPSFPILRGPWSITRISGPTETRGFLTTWAIRSARCSST